jgi:hypothetical protein
MNRKRDAQGFDCVEDNFVHKVTYADDNAEGDSAVVATDTEQTTGGEFRGPSSSYFHAN